MKKILLFSAIIAVITVVWSCQKTKTTIEKGSNLSENYNDFKSDTIDPTDGLDFKVIFDSSSVQSIINNEAMWPTLVLWRKKTHCTTIGICKFKMKDATKDYSFIGRDVNLPLIFNSSSNTFSKIKIEFTSSPSSLDSDMIKFYIDENFDLDVTPEMNLPFNKIRIQKRIIEYDSTLGQYGGYELSFLGIY